MKRTGKVNWSLKAWLGALSLVLILVAGLTMEPFSLVSHAQSQGKVTANSANIRKEADPSSQVLGSAAKDASVTINHQTKGSDGNTWYQVFVNAETLGYIRADLVSITDGSTPTTVTSSSTSNTTTSNNTTSNTGTSNNSTTETPATVTAVSPVSGKVKGGNQVRVRSNASTTSQIVTTVERGSVLTVTGQATGADNKVWYQVEFISNGAEVNGFIRSDYVELSGELTPVVEEPPAQPTQPEESGSDEQPVTVNKDWDTQLQGDEWYLLDMVSDGQYNISEMFAAIEQNKAAYEELEVTYKELEGTVKSQKLVIIILIIALIGLGAGVAFLVFKIKDMTDAAYFEAVERDTMRRSADRPQGSRPKGTQNVMHTVGEEKKPSSNGQATRTVKPSGGQPQGSKAATGKPSGAKQGTRPAGAAGQGTKAVVQPGTGKATGQSQGARPAGAQPQTGRPVSKPQNTVAQNKKPKNFMADDDEFEFEFLNWDGEEE